MKRTILSNWTKALLIAGAFSAFVACDDDDEGGTTPPPTGPGIEAVVGAYSGTMSITSVAPSAEEGEEPAGTALDATVTDKEVQFKDFPVRDLIAHIVGEDQADAIAGAIGAVDYAVPYTASLNEEKTAVTLTLKPEALKITMEASSGDGGEEQPETAAEEPATIEIEVSISAAEAGSYTIESEKLGFSLAVENVSVAGTPLEGFLPFSLDFDLAKK